MKRGYFSLWVVLVLLIIPMLFLASCSLPKDRVENSPRREFSWQPSAMVVSEEVAGKIYTEQVQSQLVIAKILQGDLREIIVNRVLASQGMKTLQVNYIYQDREEAPGKIQGRYNGNNWYITSLNQGGAKSSPSSTIQPDLNVGNVVGAQQQKSQNFIEDLFQGKIQKLTIGDIVLDGNTATFTISALYADNQVHSVKVGAIQDGGYWFLLRFEEVE